MIKKNIKWYILGIIIFLNVIIIPITFSKYATTLSKTLKLNILANEKIAYFKSYDGNDNFLGFDKTNIESFSRNIDLTKEEVLEKENVQLISNTIDDDYKSKYEIYGWIEDNNFYWWSEADIVYFHPKTMNAFKELSNIITINLTGTSTSKVENFSSWFYNDKKLERLIGKINTSGLKAELGNNISLINMFNYCEKLETIDLSEFYTENVVNMSGMFSNCLELKKIDLSSFDTSKVKSMRAMFNHCYMLTKLDLSNFNTSNVEDMQFMFNMCNEITMLDLSSFNMSKVTNAEYMFNYMISLKILIFGEKFLTFNNASVANMFASNTKLRVIFSKQNLNINSIYNDQQLFKDCVKLIGGFGTDYETPFDSDYIDGTYAKISNENQAGYFTYYNSIDDIKFNITYNLNGGSVQNKGEYYLGIGYKLENPVKEGYTFIGWTGSNGDIPEINVTISEENMGNKHYIAHYLKNNEINILGPCTFRGSSNNILGENCKIDTDDGATLDYRNYKYIDTGIYLFSEENKSKDFEISFTIDSIDGYSNNDTIISSMCEAGSPWPGFVYRINTSTNKLNLRAGYNGNTNWEMPYTSQNIKIIRENNILYYIVDGADPIQTVNFSNFNSFFDYPLTIGAGLDETKNPRRYFKGTLSNISIKLK